jgi:opacity protein-like surface antigen
MKAQKLRPFATALAALGMAWPAIAADMPLKGPLLPPPAPVYSWGGYYFGGNIGYSWGKEDLNLSGFAVAFRFPARLRGPEAARHRRRRASRIAGSSVTAHNLLKMQ